VIQRETHYAGLAVAWRKQYDNPAANRIFRQSVDGTLEICERCAARAIN